MGVLVLGPIIRFAEQVMGWIRENSDADNQAKKLHTNSIIRFKKAVDAGEHFIHLTHKIELKDEKQTREHKIRDKYEREFWRYNQG